MYHKLKWTEMILFTVKILLFVSKGICSVILFKILNDVASQTTLNL